MSSELMQVPDVAANPEVKVSQEDVAKQYDLVPTVLKAPNYQLIRRTQVQGGASITLSDNATTLSQFDIPGSNVYNFSRSYITIDMSTAADTTLTNYFVDRIPFETIQLLTASGQPIARLSTVQAYTKVAQPLALSKEEYLSRGRVYNSTALGTGFPISQAQGCQPAGLVAGGANAVVSRARVALFANYGSDAELVDDGAGAVTPSESPAIAASGTDLTGLAPQILASSATGAVAAIRWRIPLKAFVGTLLAMDRDFYFGQNLQLEILWKARNNISYCSNITGGAITASAAALTTSKYYLYLCQNVDAGHVGMMREQFHKGGFEVLIPYTNCSSIPIPAAAGTYTISTQLTPGMGRRLKRCITIPILNSNANSTTSNNFNVGAIKWSQVQSSLDGRMLQQQALVVQDSDHWNYLFNKIKNSAIGMSQRTLDNNSFMLDDFSDADDSTQYQENDCKESGLIISVPMTYEVQFVKTGTVAHSYLQYQTYIRALSIRPDGIKLAL